MEHLISDAVFCLWFVLKKRRVTINYIEDHRYHYHFDIRACHIYMQ